MRSRIHSAPRQAGSFLLETLIAILIIALGILGLVGLQARSMQNTQDSQFRSEAAFLANDLLGQMWLADQTTLTTGFVTGASAGTPYDDLKNKASLRLPGASISGNEPTVTVAPRFGDPTMGFDVVITIFWEPPGGVNAGDNRHRYQTSATVKLN